VATGLDEQQAPNLNRLHGLYFSAILSMMTRVRGTIGVARSKLLPEKREQRYRLHREEAPETVDWYLCERAVPAKEANFKARRVELGYFSDTLSSICDAIEEMKDGSLWLFMVGGLCVCVVYLYRDERCVDVVEGSSVKSW